MKKSRSLIIMSALRRDIKNKILYGIKAPLKFERIYVKTEEIKKRIYGIDYSESALIFNHKWPTEREILIMEEEYTKLIVNKYENDLSWEESGYIENRMSMIKKGFLRDGVISKEIILNRCKSWDAIYNEVKKTGRMKSRKDIDKYPFRERGGIMISISDKGELIKTGQGNHRLLIAKILNVPVIPAQIGLVHVNSMGILNEIREFSKEYTETLSSC